MPTVRDVLASAVDAVGGTERPGQITMADAVGASLEEGRHLLVQAGTGTGKSLGYLVPSILYARATGKRVVVATATLALQHQLIERDIPALKKALTGVVDDVPHHAVVKGRGNYACLHRVREGVPDDQGALVELPEGSLGAEVLALREWADQQADDEHSGDRDAAPSHTDRAWRQVSVSSRECIGATRCPYGQICFAERAREDAQDAGLIVTNHAMLALHTIEGLPMLPEFEAVVVDEAHELAARVTQASTDDLDPAGIERAARRARAFVDEPGAAEDLTDAADALADALTRIEHGRIAQQPQFLSDVLGLVRDSARACMSAFPKSDSAEPDAGAQQAKAMVDEVRVVAERMALAKDFDVLWLGEDRRQQLTLHIAPVDVSAALREKLFEETTTVLTSATLTLGASFDPVAKSLGLRPGDDTWSSLDVGSPFDYGKQGMLYVAKHLPAPGRDGLEADQLGEITALVKAAGGRTLGLFSSRRAAERATEYVREALPDFEILCQGDAQLSELAGRFAAEPSTSLFGTLSLWQGLDLPGDTCTLVIIDRIPFPRPDDPLMSARTQRVAQNGGNGFMAVSAHHAALLLAQGAGRLIRRTTDKGVVAILDPRLVTARYGSFLAASLPPLWRTTDRSVVVAALGRLDDEARQPDPAVPAD